MENVMISVIMSVYNTKEKWLRASIESILSQSFRDFEFIIVSDCPTDGSTEILREYAARDTRIVLLENEKNEGAAKSRNKALRMARGRYIAQMDADDVSLPERLGLQYRYMEAHPETAVCGTMLAAYEGGCPKSLLMTHCVKDPERERIRLCFRNAGVGHPTAMIRRAFLAEHGIVYDDSLRKCEDYDLWVKITDAGGKIDVLPRILLKYREHGSQLSGGVDYSDSITVHRAQLSKLLGEVTERDLSINRNLLGSVNRFPYESFCGWLCRFQEENRRKKLFPEKLLEEELLLLWLIVIEKGRLWKKLLRKTPFGTGPLRTFAVLSRDLAGRAGRRLLYYRFIRRPENRRLEM